MSLARQCLFHGISTIDMIYAVKKNPRYNTKVKANEFRLMSGGQALNAAITCSALGGDPILVSYIGSNGIATIIHDELREYAVQCYDLLGTENHIPPISSIISSCDEGDRTILTSDIIIHNKNITGKLSESIQEYAIVYIDGYHTEMGIEIAKIAKKKNTQIVMDGGTWKRGYEELIKYIDIIVVSNTFRPPGTGSFTEVQRYLRTRIPNRVFTNGNSPIIVETQEGQTELPIKEIDCIDTLGAGDILQGAMCYFLSKGNDICEAVSLASRIATKSCEYLGTRAWITGNNIGKETKRARQCDRKK